MIAAFGARARMERSTIGSIAIHVLVALSIPALAWTAANSPVIETVSFKHVVHIQIVRPPAPAPRPRAVAPHYRVTPSLNTPVKVAIVKQTQRAQSSKVAVATDAPAAPAVSTVAQAGDVNARGGTVSAATPSPQVRAVASESERNTGGYLPFGAEQPMPVLDPDVRKQLAALGIHVTLIVTVGDDGHTGNIVFQPPVDPQIENKIRSLLADASWDPAVCGGGVACEAQATIKL